MGGALAVAGAFVTIRGIPGAGVTGGIGVKAAGAAVSPHGAAAAAHIGLAGVQGGLPLIMLGAMAIGQSIENSKINGATLDAALENCKKQSPSANHSRSFLNFGG